MIWAILTFIIMQTLALGITVGTDIHNGKLHLAHPVMYTINMVLLYFITHP